MRINRRFLYVGTFLVALGAVLVAADLNGLDLAVVRDALRLWPIAVVLLGVALVVRRSPVALPLGLLAAATPGLVLGGAIAIGPRFITDCGDTGRGTAAHEVHQGAFDASATVSLEVSCGTLDLKTAEGSGWTLDASNTRGRLPVVAATAQSLSIADPGHDRFMNLDAGRDTWQVTLPTTAIGQLSMTANANRATMDLAGATLDGFDVTANASQITTDLTHASVRDVRARVNFSEVSIELPALDLSGDVRVNAGAVRICVPPGVLVRITGRGVASDLSVAGADGHDFNTSYLNPSPTGTTNTIDLTVNASFSAVEINPIGGCK